MTGTVRAALGLGSNLGDRQRLLDDAIFAITETPGVQLVARSACFETTPVGGPEQPDFLNAVVVVDTSLTAEDLLEVAQRCERVVGRVRNVEWGPRTLDVDVLAYDDQVSDSALLTLPHPRATQRAFVMVPWAAVDPDFIVSGRPVSEWAESLDRSGVRPADGVR